MPVTIVSPPPKAAKTSAANSTGLSKTAKTRADGLNGIGQLITAGLLFTRQYADSGAVYKFWPGIATEGAKLAEDNAKMAEFLDSLTAVGPFAGLITATMPLIAQVLVNHDRVPVDAVGSLGVVSKETLRAQVQTQLMLAEMTAMQEQMEVDKERASMLAEYERLKAETQDDRNLAESPDAVREYA